MIYRLPTINFTGVYIPVFDKRTNQYVLQYSMAKFNTPTKFYGELQTYYDFYCKAFKLQNFNSGILLTGLSGSGKTELAKRLCNFCIDNGLNVINLYNVEYRDELIQFLSSLNKVVFFFDEMGKTFYKNMQNKMLTMLSNNIGLERVVIITENEPSFISDHIRNRPGRIRYAKHFTKLSRHTIEEAAIDYGCDEQFLNELLRNYEKITTFTFDHLQAILTEHKLFPNMPFKEIISYLNLEVISGVKGLKLISCSYKGQDIPVEKIDTNPKRITLSLIEHGGVILLKIPIKKEKNESNETSPFDEFNKDKTTVIKQIRLTEDSLISMDDEYVRYKTKDVDATFKITNVRVTDGGIFF